MSDKVSERLWIERWLQTTSALFGVDEFRYGSLRLTKIGPNQLRVCFTNIKGERLEFSVSRATLRPESELPTVESLTGCYKECTKDSTNESSWPVLVREAKDGDRDAWESAAILEIDAELTALRARLAESRCANCGTLASKAAAVISLGYDGDWVCSRECEEQHNTLGCPFEHGFYYRHPVESRELLDLRVLCRELAEMLHRYWEAYQGVGDLEGSGENLIPLIGPTDALLARPGVQALLPLDRKQLPGGD